RAAAPRLGCLLALVAPAEAVEEREHAFPRVRRGRRVLLVAAVEEAVGRAVVGDELVRDAGLLERALERGVVLGRDALVGSRLQCEDRRRDLAHARDHLARSAVAADGPGEAVSRRRREPRVAPAEAEANGEDRAAAEAA